MQSLGSNNNRVGASPPSISNLNRQADSIAAILQATGWGASTPSSGSIQAGPIAATARSEPAVPAGRPEEHATCSRMKRTRGNDDKGDDDEDGGVDGHLSPREGELPDDDDQRYDADDDSWEKKIGSRNTARKKSPQK